MPMAEEPSKLEAGQRRISKSFKRKTSSSPYRRREKSPSRLARNSKNKKQQLSTISKDREKSRSPGLHGRTSREEKKKFSKKDPKALLIRNNKRTDNASISIQNPLALPRQMLPVGSGAASLDDSRALTQGREPRSLTKDPAYHANKFVKARRDISPPHLIFESGRLE